MHWLRVPAARLTEKFSHCVKKGHNIFHQRNTRAGKVDLFFPVRCEVKVYIIPLVTFPMMAELLCNDKSMSLKDFHLPAEGRSCERSREKAHECSSEAIQHTEHETKKYIRTPFKDVDRKIKSIKGEQNQINQNNPNPNPYPNQNTVDQKEKEKENLIQLVQ